MLLKLKDIGKIYETNNLYTIGIRYINLEFNLNEFITIEGESGSGKSTLLNVIGATDTYEEGDLYFNGSETSHYSVSEWDKYREENIATVFQDFNIIENLTVLENVEIALLRIENLKQRKLRAKELIEKVGLIKQINQKASKLSGGEKQRTVIARALAKDAPIILADEPTGNLDQKSSFEIARLLKEVSKDKLIIVVTHNPEFFEKERTRQIILKDGSVILDNNSLEKNEVNESVLPVKDIKETKSQRIKNTLWLGTINYKSRPKFTILMSFILIIFALALFFVLAFFSDYFILPLTKTIEKNPVNGKLLVANQSRKITNDEYIKLVNLLKPGYSFKEQSLTNFFINISKENKDLSKDYQVNILYDPFKYQLNDDEALLEIAYSSLSDNDKLVNIFKNNDFEISNIKIKKVLSLTNPRLYVGKTTLLKKGLQLRSMYSSITIDNYKNSIYSFRVNEALNDGEISLLNSRIWEAKGKNAVIAVYPTKTFKIIDDTKIDMISKELIIELSTNDYNQIFSKNKEDYLNPVFYFQSNSLAKKAADKLSSDYSGIISSTTYYVDTAGELFFQNTLAYFILTIVCLIIAVIISIIFSKNVGLFSADFAIYRTLGINRKTAKGSLYIQMLLIFLPTIILLPLVSLISAVIPGSSLKIISFGNYLFIEIMMFLIVQIVAFRFNKSIVLKSIRKSLARGLK